jgi:hypothetical protein
MSFELGIAGYERNKRTRDVNDAFGMFIGVGHYRDDIRMATIKGELNTSVYSWLFWLIQSTK